MSTRFPLVLPRAILEQMIAQARAELPNECCGLLAGRQSGIERCFPLVNEAASPVEYLSEPRSMFDAMRAIDRAGLDILAVYHSHPTSEPVPSKKDRERNYAPEVANFIISLASEPPSIRCWWLTEDSHAEAEWNLVD